MNGLGDGLEEGGDFGDELGRAAVLGDSVDNGATHHHAVSEGGDLSGL